MRTAARFNLTQAIDILRRTPGTVRVLLRSVAAEWAHGTEGPDTFSPFDNIGHLIDGEETDWLPRTRIILAQGANRRFEPYDRFRHRARNKNRTLDSLLDEFASLRAENLRVLESWKLTEAQLDLRGEHPEQGPVTLRELVAAWVVHDLGHIAQIARVMAKQYRPEVGSWVPYLPVLTDHEKPRS
jgi:hypothetical protein